MLYSSKGEADVCSRAGTEFYSSREGAEVCSWGYKICSEAGYIVLKLGWQSFVAGFAEQSL